MLKRDLTKKECEEWNSNPNKNPLTNRKIKNDGTIFKLIKRNCEDNENKILNPATRRYVLKSGLIGKKLIIEKISSYNYYKKEELLKKTFEELVYLYENKCDNQIPIIWERNSCYVDSFFVALFHKKDKFIEDVILNAHIFNYKNKQLSEIAKEIKKELYNIYIQISHKSSILNKCSNIRNLLQKFYSLLIKIHPNKSIPDIQNWTSDQNDIYDLYQLLFERVFNMNQKTLKINDNGNIIYTPFITEIPVDLLIGKKEINLNDYYPVLTQTYELDERNKYVDSKGIYHSSFTKTYELLKADKILIRITRNLRFKKLKTIVIPPLTLKLKENKHDLHLSSLIIHEGTNTGGHYTCIYVCNSEWYLYNDISTTSTITKIGSYENLIKNKNFMKNIVGIIYTD